MVWFTKKNNIESFLFAQAVFPFITLQSLAARGIVMIMVGVWSEGLATNLHLSSQAYHGHYFFFSRHKEIGQRSPI